jgi:hypothetical protein
MNDDSAERSAKAEVCQTQEKHRDVNYHSPNCERTTAHWKARATRLHNLPER